MTADEVLARLAEQARASVIDFVALNSTGTFITLNEEALRARGHLVKKVSTSEGKTNSVAIELYDGQTALLNIGKHLGLFKDQQTNFDIDMDSLTDEQLERIANGEDPVHVLATSGEGEA